MDIIKENKTDSFKSEITLNESTIEFICLVGPIGSAKRGFMDTISELQTNLPFPPKTEILHLSYSEENLI